MSHGIARSNTIGDCPCCKRRIFLTLHHLIPKKMHRRPRFKKRYSRQSLNQGIMICRQCHDGSHRLYDEMSLALRLNSLSALLADQQLQLHFNWVAKQKVNLNQ